LSFSNNDVEDYALLCELSVLHPLTERILIDANMFTFIAQILQKLDEGML